MAVIDKCAGLSIDEIRPVSRNYAEDGGICISWSGDIGFGQYLLFWKDGKLHADTEFLDKNDGDRRFTAEILRLLAETIIIDE